MKNKNKEVYKKYGSKCTYCGCEVVVEDWNSRPVDHIIPKSNGGKNTLKNLRPVCTRCNSSKQAHSLHEWKEKILKRKNLAEKELNYCNRVIEGIEKILNNEN